MSEKLVSHLTVHLPHDASQQIQALAEAEGMSASAYLRELAMSHLDRKRAEFEFMSSIFGAQKAGRAERAE